VPCLCEKMSQFDYIKDIAKYGLENDQDRLLHVLSEFIDHSRKTKKINLALQLQSILKNSQQQSQHSTSMVRTGSLKHQLRDADRDTDELILEQITSDYRLTNLVADDAVKSDLKHLIDEHRSIETLRRFDLPVANRVLFYGPSGCGKTLSAYVLAGELGKLLLVVNLGALVSSKLGETSKNLARLFRRAATEDCILFLDEFDSIGKIRDYSQDHGEMKRVVNTILQLFDYLPQETMVVAATNHEQMLDQALLRRFDLRIKLEKPDNKRIKELVYKILRPEAFVLDNPRELTKIITACKGLSYYTIQQTLHTAVKRSLLALDPDIKPLRVVVDSSTWKSLLNRERQRLEEETNNKGLA
jgi:SpoVK/Ycf46/Vps4 family AAA+-type ATPase